MFGRPDRTTASSLGNRLSIAQSSPLEGIASYRARRSEVDLGRLGRREWWLWFSALSVTALSGAGVLLASLPRFFQHSEHFYEIRPEQARWGILYLVLLFNGWMVYRQWSFRRTRRRAEGPSAQSIENAAELSDPSGMDPATGLLTRTSALLHLGKEIARAKRQHSALSLATVHLEDLADLNRRFGNVAVDQALKEFARRLKEVSRGSDYAVRLSNDDFVLILPKCNLGEVSQVLN